MGEPVLQLADRANWQEVYDETFVADAAPHGRFYPIPPRVAPILLTSPIVCLAASSTDAPPHWKLGYFARQYIGGTGLGAIEGVSFKAFLNRLMLCRFPMLAPQYQLRIEIPWWHRSMSVAIWEYTGTVDDTTDRLIREEADLIRVDLQRIEFKIDNP